MATTKKSSAKRSFCVWADFVRRVHQHVDAKSPKHAYELAKKRPDGWEFCHLHDSNGYRLSNEVQDLETEEFLPVQWDTVMGGSTDPRTKEVLDLLLSATRNAHERSK